MWDFSRYISGEQAFNFSWSNSEMTETGAQAEVGAGAEAEVRAGAGAEVGA